MFMYKYIIIIALLSFSNPLFACIKFCTVDDQPIEKYDYIWKELRDFYGIYMPKKITVEYVSRGGGSFDAQSESIHAMIDGPDYIVAHEACHVALAKMTKGVSDTENFRFIDEGWASIVGSWFNEYKNTYKRTAIREALKMKSEKGISFEDVKSWTSYFGPWEIASVGQNLRNYKAYSVGSSFVYYLTDNYGDKKLKKFFVELGQIRDLDKTLQKVYKKTASQIEKEWLEYISTTI